MLMNLPFVSLISDILGTDVTTIISSVLHINFANLHTDSEVVLSITLIFSRMFSLAKIFH